LGRGNGIYTVTRLYYIYVHSSTLLPELVKHMKNQLET